MSAARAPFAHSSSSGSSGSSTATATSRGSSLTAPAHHAALPAAQLLEGRKGPAGGEEADPQLR